MNFINKVYKWLSAQDAILIIVIAIVMNRFTSWLPEYYYIKPFPFHKILDKDGHETGLTIQTYYYIFCYHLQWLAFWQYCKTKNKAIPQANKMFYAFRAIEIVSLLDFFLIYEQSWGTVFGWGVEFTDFKILLYLIFFVKWTNFRRSSL
ncbi:MAG TPA: hypothetical protein VL443_24425 [Cyclobacteriaceae bacterium]|jgi:hypothetical protein|nr:hypothetical protein [Cyclobacteriaceae bacterium]